MSTRKGIRKGLGIAAALTVLTGGATLSAVSSASAETYQTVYLIGNTSDWTSALQVFYNSNCNGSSADFYGNVPSYGGYSTAEDSILTTYVYIFATDSSLSGHGQAVKNNAASATNYNGNHNYTVYYNSGYAGHAQTFAADGSCENLDATLKNENASQKMS